MTARELVAKVATPDELSVPVPIVVEPSLKVTVPVGMPAVWLTTVAVNVTEVLNVAFKLLDAIAVVVEDFDTT